LKLGVRDDIPYSEPISLADLTIARGAAKVLISKTKVDQWVGKLLEKGARDAVLETVEKVYPNLDDPEVNRMMRVIYGQEWQLSNPPYAIS